MRSLNQNTDFRALAFLKMGALVRIDGQWRFHGTRVGDSVVDRLVIAGRASRVFPEGLECIILKGCR